jgi:hypothetical protein
MHLHENERGAPNGSEEADASRETAQRGDALVGAAKAALGGGTGKILMSKYAIASGTVFGKTARIEYDPGPVKSPVGNESLA